jgi:hypothetical protein
MLVDDAPDVTTSFLILKHVYISRSQGFMREGKVYWIFMMGGIEKYYYKIIIIIIIIINNNNK